MKRTLLTLGLLFGLLTNAWAQPSDRLTLQGQIAWRDLAARVAEAMHLTAVVDPDLFGAAVVDAREQKPMRVLQHAAGRDHERFDYLLFGRALIVGRPGFVDRYRDVVTSILPVQPGHERAVVQELTTLYRVVDADADTRAHQVVVKVPRFMYTGMKLAVARIDGQLPAAATAP